MAKRPSRFHKAQRELIIGLAKLTRSAHTHLLALAVIVGVISAVGAILFWALFDFVRGLAFGMGAEIELLDPSVVPWWLFLLVPTGGGLLIGLFIHYLMPDRRAHGLADVVEAVETRDGRLSLRTGLGAALVSAASIGVGASVGREGPVVHLGATLGSWIAEKLGLHRAQLLTLLGCGAAAAVAASFNAPIAGAFFALEVVLGQYALRAFAPVVIASVIGALVYRVHLGDAPTFIKPEYMIASLWEFPGFVLLGVVSAFVAIFLMWSVLTGQELAKKIPVPPWVRPAIAGLLVGLIALAYPQVLGVGYATTNAVLNQSLAVWLIVALIPAKIVATAISLGGGFGGGIFSPALFVGAMAGGTFGYLATDLFLESSSGHGAYALIGMGAVAAAVLNAPMSTILIIFELTGDYAATIAVMVAVVIASLIVSQLVGGSFFYWQLQRRGIDVSGSTQSRLLRQISVRDEMDKSFRTVLPSTPVEEVRQLLLEAPHGELFVVDDDYSLIGTITFANLREVAFDRTQDDTITAVDLTRKGVRVLTVDENLDNALKIFETQDDPHIPVVKNRDNMVFVGLIHERDVILCLNRAVAEIGE